MKLRHLSSGVAIAAVCIAGTAGASSLLTGKNIKNGSLTGADIKNKSLTSSDFRGSIRGSQGPQGAPGSPGIIGLQTADGAEIPQCSSGAGACQVVTATATCPTGTSVISGGYVVSHSLDDRITYARVEPPSQFAVVAVNEDALEDAPATVQARAVCAQLDSGARSVFRNGGPDSAFYAAQARAELKP